MESVCSQSKCMRSQVCIKSIFICIDVGCGRASMYVSLRLDDDGVSKSEPMVMVLGRGARGRV